MQHVVVGLSISEAAVFLGFSHQQSLRNASSVLLNRFHNELRQKNKQKKKGNGNMHLIKWPVSVFRELF